MSRQVVARRPRQAWITALLLLSLAGCRPTAPVSGSSLPPTAKADEYARELHTAIWNRLALMPAVAESKFHQQKPISDPVREADVIDHFRMQAVNRGIHPDFAEQVMQAQIDAAILTQKRLHAEWKVRPPAEDAQLRDLMRELRPSIDQANERLLIALQLLGSVPAECGPAIEAAFLRNSPLPPQVPGEAWERAWGPLRAAPKNFLPGRAALGEFASRRATPPENQPLLPELVPEEEE